MIQEEWSVISGQLAGRRYQWQTGREATNIIPIVLTMIDEGPQSVFCNSINPFSKAIGLWMIGGAETKLSSYDCEYFLEECRCELRVSMLRPW